MYTYDTEVIEAWHDGGCGCRSACQLDLNISDADKAFIAAANPTQILALLNELDTLRAAAAATGAGQL